MQKEVREAFRVQFKWSVLQYAKGCRTDAKAYRDFDVPKSTFYGWKRAYEKEGKAGLYRKKPIP
jgi:transposase